MSMPPDISVFSDADRYRQLRAQIEFEDNLIVQRLNWFVASQSFLFTAYAITLNAPTEPAWPLFRDHQRIIFHLIPLVALLCSGLIYLAVVGGIVAQLHLHREFRTRVPPQIAAAFPRLQGAGSTRLLGLAAPLGIPMVFALVWAFLLLHGFHRL
ncbi:MAG TPA: hypothetical protein VHM90_00530 [Phycisphaerae bacterium]|jgi:hypothetical protein|nr:hypothetical protein [Phycisphaerae bacterium]